MSPSRLSVTLMCIVTLSVVGYLGSEWYRSKAIASRDAASTSLAMCEGLASQIKTLRQQRTTALLSSRPSEELTQRIEAWGTASGIEPQQLVRIEPQSPRRVGDSPYLEQATNIEVTATELAKLVQFTQRALAADESLALTSLRVIAPRRGETADTEVELWQAEIVLASRIYSPAN